MKACKACKESKPLEAFHRDAQRKDGLRIYCKACDKVRIASWGSVNKELKAATHKAWIEANPINQLLSSAKTRAKKAGLPFDLTIEDIQIPEVCPVLGIPLIRNLGGSYPTPNSPSIDRIIPTLGYVRGNIAVISNRANTIKQDANVEELTAVRDWLDFEITRRRVSP